ncbi:hypothetical protein GCM10028822_16570 [Hymenobacter terrigena]
MLLGLATPAARAQTAPTWASVRRLPAAASAGQSRAESIALAADGSQYVVGRFTGTLVLGGTTLTAGTAGTGHLYLAKYSAAGAVLWATQLEANSGSVHAKVAVDAAGNAYLAGDFDTFLTLGTTTLTAPGAANGSPIDAFLVKYDNQGVQQWVRQAVGTRNTGAAYLYGVATDASGNVTITGDFTGSVAFSGTLFTGAGVYLYRFSSAGTVLLSKQVSNDGFADDLVLDAAGNAYITGGFYNGTAFGSIAPSNAGNADLFLCKVSAAGTTQWVQAAGGPGEDVGVALALDAAGNAVVGGYYGSSSKYVVRVTNQGTLGWTRVVSSSILGYSPINAVAYDGRGGFYVAGRFTGTAVFGATTLTSVGSSSACVARYDGQGNAVWAGQSVNMSPSANAGADGLAADAAGNVYLVGFAADAVQFGSLPVSTGASDAVVAKLTAGGILTATRPAAAGLVLAAYPNPASGTVTLRLPVGGGQLAVLDALGRPVRQQALPATAGDCPVSLTGLAPGLYQLRATLGNGQPATAPLLVR